MFDKANLDTYLNTKICYLAAWMVLCKEETVEADLMGTGKAAIQVVNCMQKLTMGKEEIVMKQFY